MKISLLLVITLSLIQFTHAQEDLLPKRPELITPSPQATAITRYGDYPVEYSRGLVDMSIPLYEIKSRSLSLPMKISFHASGRMANETNGILGMRWVLNCGGIVTREMRARPDEWSELTPYTVNPNATPEYLELYRSCPEYFRTSDYNRATKYDSEYDVFKYVLPSGKSGQFFLTNTNGIKKPMTVPYEPLKIDMVQDNSLDEYYGAVNITDVDGTTYCYGDGTVSGSSYCELNDDNPSDETNSSVPTGWYLRYIISADRQDTIHLEYEHKELYKSNYWERISTADRIRDYSITPCNYYPNDEYGPQLFDYIYEMPREYDYPDLNHTLTSMSVPFLTSVKFDHGVIDFKYTTDLTLDRNNVMLNEIEISGAISRKIKFETTLNANEKDIHYLKTLQISSIKDGIEIKEEKYGFEYYEPTSSTYTFDLYHSSRNKDWWGYYNKNVVIGPIDPVNGVLVTPEKSIPFHRSDCGSLQVVYRTIGSNTNRDTDIASKKLGMLKSITFPTGGKTIFDYEDNYYTENGYTLPGPGIRIKDVLSISNNGENIHQWFEYGDNENGGGFLNNEVKPGENSIHESGMMVYWDFYLTCDQFGQCYNPKTEKLGYRIRDYISDPVIVGVDNNILYNVVVAYEGKEDLFVKDVYTYYDKFFDTEDFIINDAEYSIEYHKIFTNPYRSWEGGKIHTKTSYKKTESGQYIPAKLETYEYESYAVDEAWDMPTYRHVAFSVDQSATASSPSDLYDFWYNAEEDYHENSCSVIGYGFRHYVSGAEKLTNKTTETYSETGTIITSQHFAYDAAYHQLKKVEILNSDGRTTEINYEYPFDNTSLAANQKMLEQNMIASPLTESHYSDSEFLQHKRTVYKEWSPNLIRPEMIFYKNGDHNEELFTLFANYDTKGNPLEVNFRNNSTAYLWGYDQTYPIAEVTNASHGITSLEIFHENFEGPEGNSALGDCKTGKRSKTGGYIKPLTNLPNGSYILEYRDKQSGFWSFQRNTVNVTSGSYEINLSGQVDDVRFYPADAQMTTYTYDPLIGMTSKTDFNGLSTYYEYDDFGRLKLIRDNDRNIVKTYTYHYINDGN